MLSLEGEYTVRVTTGGQSSADAMPVGGSIAMVVYGHEGKTGKITLQPASEDKQHLLPGETDDFKVTLSKIINNNIYFKHIYYV